MPVVRRQPASHAGTFYTHRKCLIEFAVILHIDELMREFMKDGADEFQIAVAQHGVKQRVSKAPQRGIGTDAGHQRVIAALREPGRKAARVVFAKITTISNAAADGETPA